MKIAITNKNKKRFCICVPTWLLLNHVTVLFIPKMLERQVVRLTYRQAVWLLGALHTCRRRHIGWKLIEVHSANGEDVEISL